MVTEEKDLKNQIEQRVVDFTNKIDVLTEELGLPKFQVIKMRFIYYMYLNMFRFIFTNEDTVF